MATQSAFKKDLSLGKISRTTMAWLLLLNPFGKGYTKDSYDKDVSHKGGKAMWHLTIRRDRMSRLNAEVLAWDS